MSHIEDKDDSGGKSLTDSAITAESIPELPVSEIVLPDDQNPAVIYLASLPSKVSRRSMRSSLLQVARLLGHGDIRSVPWHMLRYQHVTWIQSKLIESVTEKTKERIALSTVKLRMSALRGALQQAWKLQLMTSDDYQRAISIKAPKGKRLLAGRALTIEELAAIFVIVSEKGLRNARDAVILMVCCFGLRRDEAVRLKLKDYDRNTGNLQFIGKGNKERSVHMSPKGRGAIERWIGYRGTDPGPLILPIDTRGRAHMRECCEKVIPTTLAAIAKAANIKPFTAHDLRRTFITRLLGSGVDISLVAGVVGHENINTTKIYDRREESAREAATEDYELPFFPKEDR